MEYVTFGRTGLKVSVAGLGCGGNSRLGQEQGKSERESIAIVRQALDLGVNLIDTAAVYRTEAIVGKAIQGVPREQVVIATKATIRAGGTLLPAADIVASLHESLRLLRTDHVDIFQLHGVRPSEYDALMRDVVPVLRREQALGKFRHLGLSESSPADHEHDTIRRMLQDDGWDSVMLGFHMLHQNARELVFPETMRQGIGTLLMFVVRNIFSQPEYLRNTIGELIAQGSLAADAVDVHDPLGFLVHEGGASSVTDAAYRFVRHEAGVHVVLFGTGKPAHVASNIASILKPPLPARDHARLSSLFGHLVGIGLDLPDRIPGP